ncbi:MAG: NADH:ubiquinone reductase (Na(+)-transporting) subunit F [Chitinophagaceae bacterium]|nr:MAG: NADH:ubiquinone reductase (Na(+)-transporting) subunit F [Chitinophagaceae bacterium]
MIAEVDKYKKISKEDYSLTGENAKRAVESGLAEAVWYQSPVPHAEMRRLLSRKDGPAIRDTFLLLLILVITGGLTVLLWGTWWVILPYIAYAVFYGTSSDSRWHECGHGTAFKTDWMNHVIYEAASFMVMRESVIWRWSHIRHHSDTIIVGRDPEIQLTRPPDMWGLFLSLFNIMGYINYFPGLLQHAFGKLTPVESTYVPDTELKKVYRNARIVLGIYAAILITALLLRSWLPIFLFVLPQFFGTWLMIIHNTTQHAGLAENVLDHRLNCRTVYMNPISRFIYWNMNYHVEHHMFPLVPYHALPKLHPLVKDDCPPVYTSIYQAWREIIPAILKQVKDPFFHIKRRLPESKARIQENVRCAYSEPDHSGWLDAGAAGPLKKEDVIRFDHGHKTFAIYRDNEGSLFATDGLCTHGNVHLSEGLVKGAVIECPKHNGRFHLRVEERSGDIWINTLQAGGFGCRPDKSYGFRVVENNNVSTFIKELVIEPLSDTPKLAFTPGDYLQIQIPVYDKIMFKDFNIPGPYRQVWERQHLFDLVSSNPISERSNNYSIASNMEKERTIRFNVRIATPPPGQDCAPGAGSSYLFSLRPGDEVLATGPFGDFHIRPTGKEMVYIGGGAGMAPIRAHIDQLFQNDQSQRKVSFWYGARSKQEIFYAEHFLKLQEANQNFNFQLALSDPLKEDQWFIV